MTKILSALALIAIVAAGCGAPPTDDVATTTGAWTCAGGVNGSCVAWKPSLLTVSSSCTAGADCQIPYFSTPRQPQYCTATSAFLSTSGGAKLWTEKNLTGYCMVLAPGYYPWLGEWSATTVDPLGVPHRIKSIQTQTPTYFFNGGAWAVFTDNQSAIPPSSGQYPSSWAGLQYGPVGPSTLNDVTSLDIEALYLPQ